MAGPAFLCRFPPLHVLLYTVSYQCYLLTGGLGKLLFPSGDGFHLCFRKIGYWALVLAVLCHHITSRIEYRTDLV